MKGNAEDYTGQNILGIGMMDRHKAWMYDHKPTVRYIEAQDDGRMLTEVRSTRKNRAGIPTAPLAGVGERMEEAVENAMELNR